MINENDMESSKILFALYKFMFRKLFCDLILLADSTPTFAEKIKYTSTLLVAFAPVAYMLNGVSNWFTENRQFASFVLFCVLINMIVGWVYHHKLKSFCWELFLKKTGVMICVLLVSYTLLEMLRLTIGAGMLADSFKAVIQVSTLLYPISKALKNIYILSNKQHPPAFIMERLYNFEKTGDLNALLQPNEQNNSDSQ